MITRPKTKFYLHKNTKWYCKKVRIGSKLVGTKEPPMYPINLTDSPPGGGAVASYSRLAC
jgi:hypothetical protein